MITRNALHYFKAALSIAVKHFKALVKSGKSICDVQDISGLVKSISTFFDIKTASSWIIYSLLKKERLENLKVILNDAYHSCSPSDIQKSFCKDVNVKRKSKLSKLVKNALFPPLLQVNFRRERFIEPSFVILLKYDLIENFRDSEQKNSQCLGVDPLFSQIGFFGIEK